MQVVKGHATDIGRVQVMMGLINLYLNGDEKQLKKPFSWW